MLNFNKQLEDYCSERIKEFNNISEKRQAKLVDLAGYIKSKIQDRKRANLTFICTHNSRRSHLGQIWAQTAAWRYGINDVETFSGGTETAAFNERAVAALIRAGFIVENTNAGNVTNPWYNVKPGEEYKNHYMFSKVYNDRRNPSGNFAAVMVCSHADENCPFVPGAERRFSITYDDPKDFDETPDETQKYDECCALVAREMFYVFEQVKNVN